VDGTVYLDQPHGAAVTGEDGQACKAEVFAAEGLGIAGDGRKRRRPLYPRLTEALDDVLRLDARPHDNADVGELCADVGELVGERALRRVDDTGALEELVAFLVEGGALVGPDRQVAITTRIGGRGDDRHELLPSSRNQTR
jgi:hypothetical protein